MNRLLAFFASYLLVSLPLAVEGVGFKYNMDAYCDYPAHIVIDSMTCGDGNKTCDAGDIMLVNGTLALKEELEATYLCTTTQACFRGESGICETYESEIYDVCEGLGLEAAWYDEGKECPSQGYYNLSAYLQVPGLEDMPLNSSKCDFVFLSIRNADLSSCCSSSTLVSTTS